MVNILNTDKSSSDDKRLELLETTQKSTDKRVKLLETNQLKEFHYKSLKYNIKRYPSETADNGPLQVGFYITSPLNNTSKLRLIYITTDNKHKGLINEVLKVYIQVTHNTDRGRHWIYMIHEIDLTPIKRITYKDDGGAKHIIPLNRSYALNNISNYETIELISFGFSIGNSAYTKSNNMAALIEYSQD